MSESRERYPVGPRGAQGARGAQGNQGNRGERGQLSRVQGRSVVVLFLIAAALGAYNLFWTGHDVNSATAARQRQALLVEQKICTTLGTLASLQPPPGDPQANPSRAYDQQLHSALAQLGPDLGCGKETR